MLRRRQILGGAAALPFAAGLAQAQGGGAPGVDGPVTLVVPYTPGTGHDILARLMSPFLSQRLGQPVVVDNRAGASGNIGSQQVTRAAPDGRTLLVQGNAFTINPSLYKQVGYDPVRSFVPIIELTTADFVLAVNPDVQAGNAREFAELSKKTRGGLDYASPGTGTPQHLGLALFASTAGIEMNHVPYRGSAPAIQDLIGRRVAAMYLPVHTALPLVQDGQIKLLAVGSEQRSRLAPNVPTMAESGFPQAQVFGWYGVLAPANMSPALVARLNKEMNDWLQLPATQDTLRAQGMTVKGGTPEAFGAEIARDVPYWAGVIQRAGITAE
ncbi:Bug family tripartite tricarboxylate transporter substrate binding protein [Roseomonas sp. BN140053]|uniref:Bug family tripartite tricarboxylate transporter substrate binding protein n=1 Tax=Roseomonas sp. BN140053 TaxID=3391898 RepID=UPI0039ED2E1A